MKALEKIGSFFVTCDIMDLKNFPKEGTMLMKKQFLVLTTLCLVMCMIFASTVSFAETFTPGTYEGSGKGYSEESNVTVKVTVDSDKITAVECCRDRGCW